MIHTNQQKPDLPQENIESTIATAFADVILDVDQFKAFREQFGFNTGHHGTYNTPDKSVYLYTKRCLDAGSEEDARQNLRVAKHLTDIGMLYPKTCWGLRETEKGALSLIAVTRKLETPITLHSTEDMLTKAEVFGTENFNESKWCSALLENSRSHLLEWLRRLDPEFNSRNKDFHPLLDVVNWIEATHMDNWGRDPVSKRLYPIDVEVLNFEAEATKESVRQWCASEG